MSVDINGPLVRTSGTRIRRAVEYDVPEVNCPDCLRPLIATKGAFYGGAVCGVTWTFECPLTHDTFEYQTATSFVDEMMLEREQ